MSDVLGLSTTSARSCDGHVDEDVAIGNEVPLKWGEPNGGSKKTTVESHKQAEIRAIVSPVPYAVTARTAYAEGWRTGKA